MKETAEESAVLKQALKHDPETPELAAEAERFPLEAEEAIFEVEQGLETAAPGSWVAHRIELQKHLENCGNGDHVYSRVGSSVGRCIWCGVTREHGDLYQDEDAAAAGATEAQQTAWEIIDGRDA